VPLGNLGLAFIIARHFHVASLLVAKDDFVARLLDVPLGSVGDVWDVGDCHTRLGLEIYQRPGREGAGITSAKVFTPWLCTHLSLFVCSSFQIWVSNHVSYLDVLVYLASVQPALGFVAKKSVFSLPLIGICAWTWGCIPVDRDSKSGNSVVSQLADRNEHPERNPVVVFPEATTSNGKYLIHFHRGAFAAGAPVKPVLLRYPSKQFSPAWESVTFGYHMPRMLTQFVNYATVTLYPVYTPSAAEKVRDFVRAHPCPVLSQ
jgi:1-acyl-sn-glycerol-3-phosphate acyltransferase